MPKLSAILGETTTPGGSASQAEVTALKAKVAKIEALMADKNPPKMVLLDEIDDVTQPGLHEVSMRVYVDD